MKIYVLGSNGMLGRYVSTYLKSKNYDVIDVTRKNLDAASDQYDTVGLDMKLYDLGVRINDVIINCIGTIKPMIDKVGTLTTIKVNSLFPHKLSHVCERNDYKLLHITTDCVFSGNDGLYNENSPHDCTDVYGKTKSLGEPENCTVIRSSIIGEEVGQGRSLIEWVKSMEDKTAMGYTNHLWNGITCLQMAKVFEDIIVNDNFWKGVKHIYSPNIFNKYELVKTISDVYNLNITVNPTDAPISCDRSLSSIHEQLFSIPDIKTQIIEQFEYRETLFSKNL